MHIAVTIKPDGSLRIEEKCQQIKKAGAKFAEFHRDHYASLDRKEFFDVIPEVDDLYRIATLPRPAENNNTRRIDDDVVKEAEWLVQKVDYIDIDFADYFATRDAALKNNIESVISTAKKYDVSVIGTWHDYKKTPTIQELNKICDKISRFRVDVRKMVTTATDYADNMTILRFGQEAGQKQPTAFWAMGEKGKISRVIELLLGGFFSFAQPDYGEGSAPGQVRLTLMARLLEDEPFCARLLTAYREERVEGVAKLLAFKLKDLA